MKRTISIGLAACVAIVALAASPAALAAKKTPTPSAEASDTKADKVEKVNLNTADEKTIAAVKGVGDKLAQELVKSRPYKTWDDVSKVKGVGSGKKLDALRKVLKLTEGPGATASKEQPDTLAKSSKKSPSTSMAASPDAAKAAGAAGSGAGAGASTPSTSSAKSSSSSASKSSGKSSSPTLAPGTKININTATKEELDALPEIGPVKAQAIVDYRNANGRFVAPEDIMKVPGIKEGTFAKIKDYVVVK
jgi:competence protein ComEA